MWVRRISTAIRRHPASATSKVDHHPEDTYKRLYRRLSALGGTRDGSVTRTLKNYQTEEGKYITRTELLRCVKELRKYQRFHHALEIMDWMESKEMILLNTDHAVRLGLISQTKGVPAVEEHFEGLPPESKDERTYGALLYCYCKEMMPEKALALFVKMDEMGFLGSSLPFNNLMSMYLRLGQPEKVVQLVKEMEVRKVALDTCTYNLWLQSCGNLGDLRGVEIVLEEMKKGSDEDDLCDWTTYSNLATIYVRAGEFEKAESALRLLEAKMGPKNREACHYLITLYARTSNLSEVHRVWYFLKSSFRVATNVSYLVLIPALAKLNDVDGIRKWFTEWELTCSSYDVRVVNSAIRAYLDHDMYDEAIMVFLDATKRSKSKLFKAREMFMVFLLKSRKLGPVLNHLKAAFSEAEEAGVEWQLKQQTVDAFFEVFLEEKDVDGGEKFCNVLKLINGMDSNAYLMLLKIYVAAGRVDPGMRQRLEDDNIKISSELESLLERVCLQ